MTLALLSPTMTHKRMLFWTSLFSILLLSFHLAQDALRARPGTWEAGPGNLVGILIIFVLLAATVLLWERRAGMVFVLLTALSAIGMPVLHFNLGSDMNKHGAPLFFVWSLIALGVNGTFSVVLWMSELARDWRNARRSKALAQDRG